jgi:hypothetical protein
MKLRCQVCGRRKPTTQEGVIVRHYIRGIICLGSYSAPYEESCAAIEEALAYHKRQSARYQTRFQQHNVELRNAPFESDFWVAWHGTCAEVSRLACRLANWHRINEQRVAA